VIWIRAGIPSRGEEDGKDKQGFNEAGELEGTNIM
jgi:hypothetical protein